MIEAFVQLKPVQFVGIFVLIVGILLIVMNKIDDSTSGGVTLEVLGFKINTPKSTIIFLSGIVIMLIPFMLTEPADKAVSKERINSVNQGKEEQQRAAEQAEQRAAQQRANEQAEQRAAQQRATEQAEQRAAQQRANEQAEQRAAQQRANEQAEQRAAQQRANEQAEQRAAQQRANEQAEQRAAQQRAAEQAEQQKLFNAVADGWSYFGKIYDSEWLTKNFDGGTDQFSAPKKGDKIIARTGVALRVGPIQLTASGWKNQDSINVINTGDTYIVKSVKVVKNHYYWVEIYKSNY